MGAIIADVITQQGLRQSTGVNDIRSSKAIIFGVSSIDDAIDMVKRPGFMSMFHTREEGSDVALHVMVDEKLVDYDPLPFQNDPFPTNKLMWRVKGRRVMSRPEEGVSSWFTYLETDDQVKRYIEARAGDALIASIEGNTATRLIKVIDENRSVLESIVDKSSRAYVGGSDGTRRLLSTTETLDRLKKMKCVWIGLTLSFCKSPLLDKIRGYMGIDNKKIPGCNPSFVLSSVIKKVQPCTSNKSARCKGDGLVAFCEEYLSKKGETPVKCTDALSVEQIGMLAYELRIDIHIVDSSHYLDLSSKVDVFNGKNRSLNEGKLDKLVKDIIGSSKTPIHSSFMGCNLKRTKAGKCRSAIVFKLSRTLYENIHVEPVFDMDEAGVFVRNLMDSGYMASKRTFIRGEGGMECKTLGDSDKDDCTLAVGKPIYMKNKRHNTSAGDDILTEQSIDTPAELRYFIKKVREAKESGVCDEIVTKADIVYCNPTVYDTQHEFINRLTMASDGEKIEISKHVFFTLKHVLGAIKVPKDTKNVSIPVDGCVLGNKGCLEKEHLVRLMADRNKRYRLEEARLYSEEEGERMKAIIEEENKEEMSIENVKIVEGVECFKIRIKGRKKAIRVLNCARPNTGCTDAMVDAHLSERMKFPLVQYVLDVGEEQCKADRENLKFLTKCNGPDSKIVKEMRHRVENGRDIASWAKRDIKNMDPVMDGTMHESFGPYKGCNLMDRVRLYDCMNVVEGKRHDPSHFNTSVAPNFTDGTNLKEGLKIELDQCKQYTSIAMGGSNKAYPLDAYGMYPAHPTPNNPSEQYIKFPILSYVFDSGFINIDKSTVDMEELTKFTRIHSRIGSLLFQILTTPNGPQVVSSVNLIAWTMDVWKEHTKNGGSSTLWDIAKTFQFDILNVKTGRFMFDDDTRDWAVQKLHKEGCIYKDHGAKFLEQGPVLYRVKHVMQHLMIVPNHCQLLGGMDREDFRDEGMIYTTSKDVNDICIMEEVYKDIPEGRYDGGILRNTIRDSISVFVLIAKNMLRIKHLQALEGSNLSMADVKLCLNTSIGKCRKSKTSGWSIDTSSSMIDGIDAKERGVHIDKMTPNKHISVAHLEAPNEYIVQTASVVNSDVRGSFEGIRDLVVSTGARVMELAGLHAPDGMGPMRSKVDSVLFEGKEAAAYAESVLALLTDHVPYEDGSGLPGTVKGYKRIVYNNKEFRENPLFSSVVAGNVTHKVCLGGIHGGLRSVQTKTSKFKNKLDTPGWNTVKASELLLEYYGDVGEPFHDQVGDAFESKDIEELLFMDLKSMSKDVVEKHKKFRNGFHEYIKTYIMERGHMLLVGPPGVGKSYMGYSIADMIRSTEKVEAIDNDLEEEEGPPKKKTAVVKKKEVLAVGPFHRIVVLSKPHVNTAYTHNALFGCKIDTRAMAHAPDVYLNRKAKVYAGVVPITDSTALVLWDELGAMKASVEEGVLYASGMGGKHIFMTDKFQSSAVGGEGVRVFGSVMKHITDGNVLEMDIEYRNRDPGYMKARDDIRKGDCLSYLSEGICDYNCGVEASKKFSDTLFYIAGEYLRTGKSDTTVVCQNRDMEGVVITTVARVMVLLEGKPECVLSHIGGGVDKTMEEDEEIGLDQEIEQSERDIYLSKINRRDFGISHGQGCRGVPLMFYKGSTWMVRKGFSTHILHKDGKTYGKLRQSSVLEFRRCGLKSCSFGKLERKKKEDTIPSHRDVIILTFKHGEDIVSLTEYEAATYLMYPFVAQRVNLIGLTLKKVVLVQAESSWVTYDGIMRYASTYEPIKYQLDKINKEYGNYSFITEICRQLHVLVTRVRSGRTVILDVNPDTRSYKLINSRAMIGEECNGSCSLFSLADRMGQSNKNGFIQTHNKGLKMAIGLRSRKTLFTGIKPRKYTDYTDITSKSLVRFPVDKLRKLDIETILKNIM